MTDNTEKARVFRELHASGCFVIPNPWDVGSARMLEGFGFRALATTSAGVAWSLGRMDNQAPFEASVDRIREIAEAVSIPVNADFEGGFAIDADGIYKNVTTAAATGVAGLSIEDSTGDTANPLFDFALSVDRIRAARRAIDDHRSGVLLTGRSEGFRFGRPDLAETIRRLVAYADAGADCLYAPGIRSVDDITAVVNAVAPRPVNVLVGTDFTTAADLARIGVRRISVGGALARVAFGAFLDAAHEIAERGTFTRLGAAISFGDLEKRLA